MCVITMLPFSMWATAAVTMLDIKKMHGTPNLFRLFIEIKN